MRIPNKLLMLLLTLAALSSAIRLRSLLHSKAGTKNKFGSLEFVQQVGSVTKKTVQLSSTPISEDQERQAYIYAQQKHNVQLKGRSRAQLKAAFTCVNRTLSDDFETSDAFAFLPAGIGALNIDTPTLTYNESFCFSSTTFTYEQTVDDDGNIDEITITLYTSGKNATTNIGCQDWFFFGSLELYHIDSFNTEGEFQFTFTNISENAKADISQNGIRIFMFCEDYVDTIISVFNSLILVLGQQIKERTSNTLVPFYSAHIQVEFLREQMQLPYDVRLTDQYDYDTSYIQSGDFLPVSRFNGDGPLIMYSTGSTAEHAAVALWFDEGLYVLEANELGMVKTAWDEWLTFATDQKYHVSHMPLNLEARIKFNETAAQEFFNASEGTAFGYQNLIFPWLDTKADNYPPLVPYGFFTIGLAMYERLVNASTIDLMVNQALNKRMNTTGLNLTELAAEAATQNMSLEDVMAIPEDDTWEYDGHKAYMCSAFVVALYKAAGLFDDYEINATEFTPRDIYTLKFFDLEFSKPSKCSFWDSNHPWCQFLGKYKILYPGYSTIEPYDHMAETCPSIAPDYYRPDGC